MKDDDDSPGTPGLRLGRLGLRGLGLAGNDRGCSKRLEFSGNFPVATLIKSNCLVSCSKIDYKLIK